MDKDVDLATAAQPEIRRSPLGTPPGLREVIDQDAELLPHVQCGVRSRAFKGALLSAQVARLRHYHAEIDHYLNDRT